MNIHAGLLKRFRRSRWRVALALLCLCAFVFDGVVAQAHVHTARNSDAATQHLVAPDKSPARKTGSDDGARCALCQFLVAGSAALVPSHLPIPATAAPSFWISLDHPSPHVVAAVSFSWRSRGPPLI